ncbi:MAG TPA: uroporphyrinogen-III C-methyltransferase [Limnochordia bacterium]
MRRDELPPGKVYIVGAGPGDPGLITVRGREVLALADVVLYDRLVSAEVLAYARPGAERIYVGKEPGEDPGMQDQIHATLIERARRGLSVVRLKGGDPFIFGRGGEEAEALCEAGIPFEIVPGITSAVAVPAYAGIPLTHRAVAASFVVATGHADPGAAGGGIDWAAIASAADTVVLLMAVRHLRAITARLIQAGRSPQTPAAVIEWGTTPRQRTVVAPLCELGAAAAAAGIGPPAVVVVGEVVTRRQRLSWFERGSLFGRRIVITRPEAQSEPLAALVRERGGIAVEFPTIAFEPPADPARLDLVLSRIGEFDWGVFTSAHGVETFAARLEAAGLDARALARMRIAAVGPTTAAALQRIGLRADVVPDRFASGGLLAALLAAAADWKGARVLLWRAAEGSATVVDGLQAAGARVEDVAAYRTVPLKGAPAEAMELLAAGKVDAITFASGSAARAFAALTAPIAERIAAARPVIACIGPETARAAAAVGFPADVVAGEHTARGLIDALEAYWRSARCAGA